MIGIVTTQSNQYRYGFNGKEKDNEVSGNGNSYDYGFRIYNPRIAKFLSVDPLFQSFPWYTPYQFAGNSPILNVDLDGLEEMNNNEFNKAKVFGKPKKKVTAEEINRSTQMKGGLNKLEKLFELLKKPVKNNKEDIKQRVKDVKKIKMKKLKPVESKPLELLPEIDDFPLIIPKPEEKKKPEPEPIFVKNVGTKIEGQNNVKSKIITDEDKS